MRRSKLKIKSELGFILPSVLLVMMIVSSLLLNLSEQLMIKTLSYEQREIYLQNQFFEKKTIHHILTQLTTPDLNIPDYTIEHIPLTTTIRAKISYHIKLNDEREIAYFISTAHGTIKGNLTYSYDDQTYILD